jgi:hypothetical protein
MINAETQLLYSSDYPHWDMDMPSVIWDLPFLSEGAKRNILGENARRLFGLEARLSGPKLQRLKALGGSRGWRRASDAVGATQRCGDRG